jgi:N-hydroxyarylamine O-acetyltransferase
MKADSQALDLDAYFARIGYSGEVRPTLSVLEKLHFAHATHIPFENLDILLGRPIWLDLPSLQAKLVRSQRGGYCFEQNLLLATVLERIGFRVTMLAARVRYRATRLLPRTHVLLQVEVDGRLWLADVGFGGAGLLGPIPLTPGKAHRQFAWTYQVVEEAGLRVVRSRVGETWQDLYAFTPEPQYLPDLEMANYYVSTHPESRFVQTLAVQRASPEVRYALRNREFTIDRGAAGLTTRMIADDDEIVRLLAEEFGLVFPAGTRFRFRDVPTA